MQPAEHVWHGGVRASDNGGTGTLINAIIYYNAPGVTRSNYYN